MKQVYALSNEIEVVVETNLTEPRSVEYRIKGQVVASLTWFRRTTRSRWEPRVSMDTLFGVSSPTRMLQQAQIIVHLTERMMMGHETAAVASSSRKNMPQKAKNLT